MAGVIGRVSNGTHSSTDRVYCMLEKMHTREKHSKSHFGSASLTVSDQSITILGNHFKKPFPLSHHAQCQKLQERHISQSNSQERCLDLDVIAKCLI